MNSKYHFRIKASLAVILVTLAFQGGAKLRIIDGTVATPGQFDSVFALTMEKPLLDPSLNMRGLCTATLIHPRVMITAAHCADGTENRPLYASNGVAAFSSESGVRVSVKSFGVYKDWYQNGVTEQEKVRHLAGANDIAYLLLEQEVTEVTPSGWMAMTSVEATRAWVGKSITLVGYGRTTNLRPEEPLPDAIGTKTWATGDLAFWNSGRLYRKGYTGSSNSGDSGGPVFYSQNGENKIIAVIASGATGVADESRVAVFSPLRREHLCWIQSETQVDLRVQGCAGAPAERPQTAPAPTGWVSAPRAQ